MIKILDYCNTQVILRTNDIFRDEKNIVGGKIKIIDIAIKLAINLLKVLSALFG